MPAMHLATLVLATLSQEVVFGLIRLLAIPGFVFLLIWLDNRKARWLKRASALKGKIAVIVIADTTAQSKDLRYYASAFKALLSNLGVAVFLDELPIIWTITEPESVDISATLTARDLVRNRLQPGEYGITIVGERQVWRLEVYGTGPEWLAMATVSRDLDPSRQDTWDRAARELVDQMVYDLDQLGAAC